VPVRSLHKVAVTHGDRYLQKWHTLLEAGLTDGCTVLVIFSGTSAVKTFENVCDFPLEIRAEPSLSAPLVGWLPPEVKVRRSSASAELPDWICIEPHIDIASEADHVCFIDDAGGVDRYRRVDVITISEERRVVLIGSQSLEEEWWIKTLGRRGKCLVAETCSEEWFAGMRRRTIQKINAGRTTSSWGPLSGLYEVLSCVTGKLHCNSTCT